LSEAGNISAKKVAGVSLSALISENKTGKEGETLPFSIRESSPLLIPAFAATSVSLIIFAYVIAWRVAQQS
jgi:hypothetical protein